jgi:spermidine synthase/tetratricopeptide (TPR) repeat protein
LAGIQGALLSIGAGSATAASLTLLASRRSPGPRGWVRSLVPLLVVAAVAAAAPTELPRKMLLAVVGPRHQDLVHYDEARTATVAVIQNQLNGERQLLINSVNEVTTRLVHDQSFKLLGHLGPLLHPHPRTAIMICLGAGLSAGAALAHPLERLDVVDLSSAVPRAARHFAHENRGVLDDPRFFLHTDDGRQFLLNGSFRYDLAIIDSTHPKSVDSWLLYTQEFYELVRTRLGDQGIVVQWLPLHGLSEREFKLIVRTFLHVFPETTLWANVGFETYGQVGYAKLVGTRGGPLVLDQQALGARLRDPMVHRDLEPYGMASVAELLDLYVADAAAVRGWTEGLPIQTDDHPIVPYTTHFSRGRRMLPALLLGVRSPALPLVRHLTPDVRADLAAAYEAQGLVLAGNLERATELRPDGSKLRLFVAESRRARPYYTAVSRRYRDDPERLFEAGAQLAALGFPEEAERSYEQALILRPRDFRLRLNHALLLLGRGQHERAIQILARLRAERPGSPIVTENLGAALLTAGDPSAARAHLRESLGWDPESTTTRLLLAEAEHALGELGRAESDLGRVLADNPWLGEAHDLLGRVAADRGDLVASVRHHREAVRLEAFRFAFQVHLGLALAARRNYPEAAAAFEAALRLEPDAPAVLDKLGQVRAAQGRLDEADELYLEALDLDPGFAQAALDWALSLRSQNEFGRAVQAFCLANRLDSRLAAARQHLAELGLGPADCDG